MEMDPAPLLTGIDTDQFRSDIRIHKNIWDKLSIHYFFNGKIKTPVP